MKIRQATAWTTALCLLVGGGWFLAFAAPPGEQLIDQVAKAYQDAQQYDATVHFEMRQAQGRWTMTQAGEIYVALDRLGNRLLIDSPDQFLVADGQKLYYSNTQRPGKHLQLDATSPLASEEILAQIPFLNQPILPTDFAFLLAADPLKVISEGASQSSATLPPDPDDPAGRLRIECALQAGKMIMTINPQTHLIDKAVVDVDTAMLGAPADVAMSYTLDFQINSLDAPIDDARFVFDATGSVASGSMQEMLASGSNSPHPLQGKDAPPLILPAIDGLDHDIATDDPDAEVIILDFWATWCGPCVAALPELQAVYDWAKDNGKPVAIYAVNQGESVQEVKQFWEDHGLTIPVLMDENFTAAQAYQVNGIPQTVIISAGKVQQVHVGYRPGIGEQMKGEIEAMLDSGGE